MRLTRNEESYSHRVKCTNWRRPFDARGTCPRRSARTWREFWTWPRRRLKSGFKTTATSTKSSREIWKTTTWWRSKGHSCRRYSGRPRIWTICGRCLKRRTRRITDMVITRPRSIMGIQVTARYDVNTSAFAIMRANAASHEHYNNENTNHWREKNLKII